MKKPVFIISEQKGADQPAHLRSLISAFVVRCLDSIISLVSISQISRLASLYSWAGWFVSDLVGNPEDRFSCDEAQFLECLLINTPCHREQLSHLMTKSTKWLHQARTQIRLDICPVWSESSLCIQWVAKDPSFLHADSEDSDQTGGSIAYETWGLLQRASEWFYNGHQMWLVKKSSDLTKLGIQFELSLVESDIRTRNQGVPQGKTRTNKPSQDKTNKMPCTHSKNSDQPGHLPNLISLRCPHKESLAP